MTASVRVDPDLCIGSAECNRIAPRAFRLDPAKGISFPTAEAPTTDPALIEEAVHSCPTGAISYQRTTGPDVQE